MSSLDAQPQRSGNDSRSKTGREHHGKVMHAAIQSGDREAIARYRNAFPILEPFSDAAIQEGATPHNCSIALARERGFEGPYHLNRCFSENISVAPRETFAALKEAVKALDLSTAAEILDAFPYLARARVYNKELGLERGASLLHLAMPRWAKDGAVTRRPTSTLRWHHS